MISNPYPPSECWWPAATLVRKDGRVYAMDRAVTAQDCANISSLARDEVHVLLTFISVSDSS